MVVNNLFNFVGGDTGEWSVLSIAPYVGESLEKVTHLSIEPSKVEQVEKGTWTLKGFTSNIRYAEKQERAQLAAVQSDLGRPEATLAALIPIRKTADWWALAQDERRQIFEEQSRHTAKGLQYLPNIARKLYHCRDIGQPFDFLTWFEYAPKDALFFEELVGSLRQTLEWQYVDWEVDVRLKKREGKGI